MILVLWRNFHIRRHLRLALRAMRKNNYEAARLYAGEAVRVLESLKGNRL